MNTFSDFINSAAPWLIMGLTLAVFFGSYAVGKKKRGSQKKQSGNYSTEGMCLGMCLGVAIGAALDKIALGLSLGMLVGMTLGMCVQKEAEDEEN